MKIIVKLKKDVIRKAIKNNIKFYIFALFIVFIIGIPFSYYASAIPENLVKKLDNTNKTLEKKLKEIELLSQKDHLTGIYNRMYFDTVLSNEISKAKRYGYPFPLSIIMFDIDYFKHINDTYGHKTGDLVLIEITKLIQGFLRDIDIFARWGGEEFVILLPHTGLEGAYMLAERLKNMIEDHDFKEIKKLTISFGVTQFLDTDTHETLMKRVDNIMYQAKRKGRNRVEKG